MGSFIDQYSKEELSEIVSNSFSYAEVLSKLGYGTTSGHNHRTVKKRIEYYNISTTHFCYHAAKHDWTDEEIFCDNSKVSQNKLRNTFKERAFVPYECSICGLPPFWNNQPLVLTLDHINGKNKDNELSNLRWVCPNCDRQSDTYGMKNKKSLEKGVILSVGNYDRNDTIVSQIEETMGVGCDVKITQEKKCKSKQPRKNKQSINNAKIKIPDREILKSKLWAFKNYTKVANFFNVSTTQIRRWCRQYGLPATISIIKYTSEFGWINENWDDIERQKPNLSTPPKPCYMIDKKSGQIVMEFSSRREAGNYIAPKQKKAEVHIGQVCNGNRKSAYGYFWKNKEEYNIS